MVQPIFPDEQRGRQAVSSLAGYAYQLYVSVLEWMDIGADGILLLEVAEDYATHVGNVLSMTQVKNSMGKVTLVGKGPVKALTSLWQHREANKEVECRLTYLTTAVPARERDFAGRAGISGIEYWGEASAGADPAPLRALLSTLTLPPDLLEFLETADDERLRAYLLRPLTWACGTPSLSAVRAQLKERLAAAAVDKGMFPDEGRQALPVLLDAVLRSIVEGDRRLTRAGFQDAFQDASSVRMGGMEARRARTGWNTSSRLEPSADATSPHAPSRTGVPAQLAASQPAGAQILRVAARPFAHPMPRPVNLLMALGASRRPAIAVTTGVDIPSLLERLRAVDTMVEEAPRYAFAPRVWEAGARPAWPGQNSAHGLIWSPGALPLSQVDLISAIAGGFKVPRPACGDVLILALPAGAEEAAADLTARIEKVGAQWSGDLVAEAIPIYLWSGGRAASTDEPLLARLIASLEDGAAPDRYATVAQAARLRLHAGAVPLDLWRAVTRDSLRLHDLSVLCSGDADAPHALDERRAVALIEEAEATEELLYSLAFLPVSAEIVAALARATPFTRAVAGLLTTEEACSRCPPWPPHRAEGFRPGRAGSYLGVPTGGNA